MKTKLAALFLLVAGAVPLNAAVVWSLARNGGLAGAADGTLYGSDFTLNFVQETANNDLPGDPNSPAADQQADDDYYFAGTYDNVVDGGAYVPVGMVAASEIAVERAFTAGDNVLRYHFNFAASHVATDQFTLSFMMQDLDDDASGTGVFDIDMSVNGNPIDSFSHTAATNNSPFTSVAFTLADVGATAGAPDDNYVELTSTASGGARWSNMNYIQLDVEPIPEPSSFGFLGLAAAAGLFLFGRRRRR